MNSFWTNTLKPALLPLYRTWIKFGDTLGWINSRIILGAVFYLLIMPMGLVLRLLGKGRIRDIERAEGESLRQASHTRTHNHFERLF
jgi:hypothetical protein